MKFCSICDTLYNLDKFIGVEVIDYSDDVSDVISIIFRFEGDYLKSDDDDNTPYSFRISMTNSMLSSIILKGITIKDIENAFEEGIHDVLKWAASEFVEMFNEELMNMPIDENYTIDLGSIKRDVITKIKETVEEK